MRTPLAKSPLQVYLRQDQLTALRAMAEQRDVSLAELVRQGVDRLLLDTPVEEDPLWEIVALGSSTAGELAANHDQHLADLEMQDNQ